MATVSSGGLATAVGPGTTTITASMNGFNGLDTGTATLTVTASVQGNLSSLTIIPNSQTVTNVNETGQFIAVGTFSGSGTAAVTKDLTSQATWSSSDVTVATINSSGLATGLNSGTTTITALATSSNGSVTTATATFTENGAGAGTQLPTLTVYKVGANAATGTVTAPAPGTTTPLVINCGSGAGCGGHFPLGAQVTLTATPGPSSTFGGWSANCAVNPSTPTECTVTMSANDTVGAIFN